MKKVASVEVFQGIVINGKSVFQFDTVQNNGGIHTRHCRTIYVTGNDLEDATNNANKCLFSDEWIEQTGKPVSIPVYTFE
jgi:hypothetical protein